MDDYIEQSDDDWRPALTRLRTICLERLTGHVEKMAYGMPTYFASDRPEVAFAKQVKYLSLYIMKSDVIDAHRTDLVGLDVGKGCVRFRRHDQIDWALVDTLIRDSGHSPSAPC